MVEASLSQRAFDNALKILRAIDLHELEAAGFSHARELWPVFRDDPWRTYLRASDRQKTVLWAIVQKRMPMELRERVLA